MSEFRRQRSRHIHQLPFLKNDLTKHYISTHYIVLMLSVFLKTCICNNMDRLSKDKLTTSVTIPHNTVHITYGQIRVADTERVRGELVRKPWDLDSSRDMSM